MNEWTHFFIKIYISHSLFSKGLMFVLCVRDGWRDIYSERGLLLPISSSRSQGVPMLAHPCKLVRNTSGRLRVPRFTAILCTLSKSHHVVLITWSSSGYTPVQLECSDRAVLFTNQNVTTCQAHGVTRNEPKIHGICYITLAGVLKKIFGILGLLLWELLMSLPHGIPGGIYLAGFWIFWPRLLGSSRD